MLTIQPKDARTGDLVFFQHPGVGGAVIRLATAFWAVLGGRRWVPNHVGVVVQDDGMLWLYESTFERKGVTRAPLELCLQKYRRTQWRIVPLELEGYRWELKRELDQALGAKYEKLHDLAKVARNDNKAGANRLFCSELAVRVFQGAGVPWAKDLDPSNTDPDELYRGAKRHWEDQR